jgi:hypothetical protein
MRFFKKEVEFMEWLSELFQGAAFLMPKKLCTRPRSEYTKIRGATIAMGIEFKYPSATLTVGAWFCEEATQQLLLARLISAKVAPWVQARVDRREPSE